MSNVRDHETPCHIMLSGLLIVRGLLLALMVCCCGLALSGEPQRLKADQGNQQPKVEQKGIEKSPLFVGGDVTIKKDKREADADVKEREAKSRLDSSLVEYTFWLTVCTGLLFLAAAIQAGLFVWQLRLISDGEKKAKVIAAAARDSANAATTSADTVMLAERAYVKLSHLAPGVRIENKRNWGEVTIEIKNHGRTPASVTDVVIDAALLDHGVLLPQPFPYRADDKEAFPNAFLVPQEAFVTTKTFPLHGDHMEDAIGGAKKLWVFGHVDYIDTFGRRHRGGYVRTYQPLLDDGTKNNLVYMTEGRYNYDRPRNAGEGNDWAKKPRV